MRSLLQLRGALLLLIVPLAGCTFLGVGKRAAVPPPPKPAAVQPPAPETALSIPQTAVTLPSLQTLNPAAIPPVTAQAPAPEKPETPPAPRASRRSVGSPPKADPDPEPETPAPPAAPAVQEQAPIRPILSGEEQNRLKNAIEGRKREINDKLRHATKGQQSLVDRITSFLTQCDQAAQRGDYSQADALSDRALILARELQGE